jgi:hypothetical protein
MLTKTNITRARSLFAIAAALTVSACGDGGSPGVSATSSLTQGRWTSTNLTPAYTAVMVPAPTGANIPAVDTVWALAHDGSTLIKLKANGLASTAGAVSGDVHTLGTSSVTAVSGSSYTVSSTATPQFSIDPLLGTTAVFERADAMSTALAPNQANGTWQADLGTVKVNWTVTTAGASENNLSGSYSTTGCTFSGQSTVVSSQSLYKVTYTESCSDGSDTTFVGIGTLSPDNNRLTVVATNEAGTRAAALLFVKQP